MKSIDIIERARSYYLLSKDHRETESKPVFVGSRIKLEYVLEKVKKDMIIATSGNSKRCIVLIDYTTEECLNMVQRGENKLLKLKAN